MVEVYFWIIFLPSLQLCCLEPKYKKNGQFRRKAMLVGETQHGGKEFPFLVYAANFFGIRNDDGNRKFMEDQNSPNAPPNPPAGKAAVNGGKRLLRAAVFFAGSAAFGGLAVALWNRKTLATMRRTETEVPLPGKYEDSE
jgi:hypothetical protein